MKLAKVIINEIIIDDTCFDTMEQETLFYESSTEDQEYFLKEKAIELLKDICHQDIYIKFIK